MKTLIVAGCWLALSVSAQAQNLDPAPAPPRAATAAPPVAADAAATTEKTGRQAVDDRNCLRHTGSRLVGKGQCANASGRAYTQEDLQRTGHANTADALRALDPAIR